jgi:hypothetical protein
MSSLARDRGAPSSVQSRSGRGGRRVMRDQVPQKQTGRPFGRPAHFHNLAVEKIYFGASGVVVVVVVAPSVVVVVVAAGSTGATAAGSVGGAGSVTAAGTASSGAVSACGPQAATPNARTAATIVARTIFVFVIGQYPSSRRDSFVAANDAYKLSHGDASICDTQLPGFPSCTAFLRQSHAFLPGLAVSRQAGTAVMRPECLIRASNATFLRHYGRVVGQIGRVITKTSERAWIRPLRRR